MGFFLLKEPVVAIIPFSECVQWGFHIRKLQFVGIYL